LGIPAKDKVKELLDGILIYAKTMAFYPAHRSIILIKYHQILEILGLEAGPAGGDPP
jgi:hypothetical protein